MDRSVVVYRMKTLLLFAVLELELRGDALGQKDIIAHAKEHGLTQTAALLERVEVANFRHRTVGRNAVVGRDGHVATSHPAIGFEKFDTDAPLGIDGIDDRRERGVELMLQLGA